MHYWSSFCWNFVDGTIFIIQNSKLPLWNKAGAFFFQVCSVSQMKKDVVINNPLYHQAKKYIVIHDNCSLISHRLEKWGIAEIASCNNNVIMSTTEHPKKVDQIYIIFTSELSMAFFIISLLSQEVSLSHIKNSTLTTMGKQFCLKLNPTLKLRMDRILVKLKSTPLCITFCKIFNIFLSNIAET